MLRRWRVRLDGSINRWARAPDGRPRPNAPFGRGPIAARVLGGVIVVSAAIGARLPLGVAHGLALVGGHLEWAARPGKRRQLATNLAHATGEPARSRLVRDLVRHEIVNEARRSADLLWAIGRPREFLAAVDVVGAEHAATATRLGRGVVVAGIHLGGWEVAAAVPAAVMPVPITVMVADDWLAWAIEPVRRSVGLNIAYRTASALSLARLLDRGEALLVFGDDAWGGASHRSTVRFCDGWAELPAGIATLARLTTSPIVTFSVLPAAPRRWVVTVEPPIGPPTGDDRDREEARVLQEVADRWTAMIRANPDQWAASFPIAWRTGE
jgi:lauroyl/myristoyl acyltransferase